MYLLNRKRFILGNILALLQAEFNPVNIEATLTRQPLAALQLQLDESRDTALATLKTFRYKVPASDFQRLCQQNYSDLFRLKDQLLEIRQEQRWSLLTEDAKTFYTAVEDMLNAVQEFLESTGIRSMAPEEMLPVHYLDIRLHLLRGDINLLRSRFHSSAADKDLKDILVAHFQTFSTQKQVNQQELRYTEGFMQAILKSLKPAPAADQDLHLMFKVVQWNFNSPEGYLYCKNKLLEALEDSSGSKGRLQVLNFQQKLLKQLLCIPNMALHPQYPDLRNLLLELLQTEIVYEQATAYDEPKHQEPLLHHSPLHHAATQHYAPLQHQAQHVPAAEEKFQLQLSQRVLAMWTQALISMKILKLGIQGQRRFTQFLADHFTTAGMEVIQPDSFRRRYKEKHSGSSEILINILEQMILMIRHEYIGINIIAEK